MLDAVLGELREHFFVGQHLTEPVAKTWFAVNASVPYTFTAEADWTYPGRTFVLGQDAPH